MIKKTALKKLPRHVAIIVDGNRRWAEKRGLPIVAGHKYVMDKVLDRLVFRCLELGIPYITFWAFSTENWKRGQRFASMLFSVMKEGLRKNVEKYNQAGIRLNTIGDLSKIPRDLVKTVEDWKSQSAKNKKLVVTIALNYGGRDEILRAIGRMNDKLPNANDKLSEEKFEKYLDTADPALPDVDLVIRTGGEQRLSGFMPWQSVYAEFYFPKTLMPDFTVKEFDKALREYEERDRRRGK